MGAYGLMLAARPSHLSCWLSIIPDICNGQLSALDSQKFQRIQRRNWRQLHQDDRVLVYTCLLFKNFLII